MKSRRARNAKLWAMVKGLPGGEQTMRDLVAGIRGEDGTGKELLGTDAYTSTRLITDGQFDLLLRLVKERSGWKKRRQCRDGNVLWIITPAERNYIRFLAKALGWSQETLGQFIEKQTKGKGMLTHGQASALVEPLERMVAERGFELTEDGSHKWWNLKKEATG